MTRNLFRLVAVVLLVQLISSCSHSKHLPYFQDVNDTSVVQKVPLYPYDPLKLMVDDQIQVVITSISPEASQFFNLASGNAPAAGVAGPTQTTNIYEITTSGVITMPVLGDVMVLGLTTDQVKAKILSLMTPYLKDAIVSVRLVNFKVTVIGEVGKASTIPIQGEHYSVLEAVGAAGDITDFGIRYNIKVLRKTEGGIEVGHLNFNNTDMMRSPFYQLHQNDIVYVEPYINKGFKSEAINTFLPFAFTITSFLISLSVLFLRLSR